MSLTLTGEGYCYFFSLKVDKKYRLIIIVCNYILIKSEVRRALSARKSSLNNGNAEDVKIEGFF